MKCPVCPESTLAMTTREGIEIDYCPTCRGVWLDRGELDKIIERASPELPPASRGQSYGERARYHDDDDERYREHGDHKKRRKGLLGELFDFD